MKLAVYNMQSEKVDDINLSDNIFKAEYNEAAIHQVVVALQNNARQGTKSTLTRSEVRGHAKKPWRQKGTGRARHGSTKAPQWTGGGVAFAPKPRDFSQKINKKLRDIAFASAISKKIAQNEIKIVDRLELDAPKTKEIAAMLEKFNISKSTMFVTDAKNDNLIKSVANIEKADITSADLLNVLDIVKNSNLILTVDAIKKIEEAYK